MTFEEHLKRVRQDWIRLHRIEEYTQSSVELALIKQKKNIARINGLRFRAILDERIKSGKQDK